MVEDKILASKDIYETLRKEITLGVIPAETLLVEARLAKRFGVSRTPVREALRLLASEGLVIALPQRGHLVRPVSLSEILDSFRVREILEIEAISEAALRISDSELEYLRGLASNRSGPNQTEINREFHLTIARIGGNRVLIDFLEKLLFSMDRVITISIERDRMDADIEHGDMSIVNALATHNPDIARNAIRDHIRVSLSALLNKYDRIPLPSSKAFPTP